MRKQCTDCGEGFEGFPDFHSRCKSCDKKFTAKRENRKFIMIVLYLVVFIIVPLLGHLLFGWFGDGVRKNYEDNREINSCAYGSNC